ncbi:hypothetical protein [Halomonas sp. BM-2019]|uniref:hypothetical protein n=1 Tax=Halomonas sp. BM-2019 TaxID=2811227 RepID=UPI001B3C287E|nr:MAG: hypothetical protein J5F18_13955 [Halomonas sp. BM-2019]
MASRSVILILVEARRASAVLEAVSEAGQLDESLETGIALELEVSRALGLSEHIKALSREHPLDKT